MNNPTVIFETYFHHSSGQIYLIQIYSIGRVWIFGTKENPIWKSFTVCFGISSIENNDWHWRAAFEDDFHKEYPIELKYYIEKIIKLKAFI